MWEREGGGSGEGVLLQWTMSCVYLKQVHVAALAAAVVAVRYVEFIKLPRILLNCLVVYLQLAE